MTERLTDEDLEYIETIVTGGGSYARPAMLTGRMALRLANEVRALRAEVTGARALLTLQVEQAIAWLEKRGGT